MEDIYLGFCVEFFLHLRGSFEILYQTKNPFITLPPTPPRNLDGSEEKSIYIVESFVKITHAYTKRGWQMEI